MREDDARPALADSPVAREAPEALRVCKKCGRTLPLDAFGRHRQRRDGLDTWCRECRRAYSRQVEDRRRAELAAVRAGQAGAPLPDADKASPRVKTKVCPRCHRELPVGQFNTWRRICRECEEAAPEPEPRRRKSEREMEDLMDTRLTQRSRSDPGYQHGLSRAIEISYAGVGECPQCHHESVPLYKVEGSEGPALCYPCRQAALRRRRKETAKPLRGEPRQCARPGCTNMLPAEARRNQRYCDEPECRAQRNRDSVKKSYDRKKEAAAAAQEESNG